jgi:hypothetical protein
MSRTIGSGPVEVINWMLPMQRLVLGGQLAEFSVRSSAFDEPLTPTNYNIKKCSTQGSAPVQPVMVDSRGFFVQRGGSRVFELNFDSGTYDYTSTDLTILIPEIGGEPGSGTQFVRIGVQRQPDTRVHGVRSDGIAAILVYDKAEQVLCWIEVETSGYVEDVVILPGEAGAREDSVYYVVRRVINGSTVRYFEKWAQESDCEGGTLNLQADSFLTYTGAATTVITGLDHLNGQSVVVWADGVDVGTDDSTTTPTQKYIVSGGQLVLGSLFLNAPGAAGDYASTPDSAALDITGDIDIIACVYNNNRPPVASAVIVAKYSSAATVSYQLVLAAGGGMFLQTSPDGSTMITGTSDSLPSDIGSGDVFWVRATLDIDDGSGNRVYNFYYSTEPETTAPEDVTWTQLGSTITTAGTTSIFSSTSPLEIGAREGGTVRNLDGRIYRAQVYNGIDGTLAADFNPNDGAVGNLPFVSSTTGETYTLFGGVAIIGNGLETAAENVVVGLPYEGQWKSAKLGQTLTRMQEIDHLGLILRNTHARGLRFGPSLTDAEMDYLPLMYQGAPVDQDSVYTEYDDDPIPFPGNWSTDARVCLKAAAPRPVTVLAAVVEGEVNR